MNPIAYIKNNFREDSQNFPLLVPILLGLGIGIYFLLSVEPKLWLAIFAVAAPALLVFSKNETVKLLGKSLVIIAFGFLIIKLRADFLNTNFPAHSIRNAQVSARAIDVEQVDEDYRVTFDKVRINDDAANLNKIRIKFSREFGAPKIGEFVEFSATLLPPFFPNAIGDFDFRRFSYFKEFSASGRGFDGWRPAEIKANNSLASRFGFAVSNLRAKINKRIESVVPTKSNGVLISMITGDIYAVSKDTNEAYKGAGISHMISISGFHMTVVAGFVFLLIRLLLMPLAHRRDTKKIAAFIAIFATLFYLLLSGARLPTVRAFIMICLGMIAIIADRSPFSMRFVAVSGVVSLLLTPEAILNPGFQMSFVAVAVLVRLYEVRDRWKSKSKLLNALNDCVIITGGISLAIAPFVIYSFNTIQLYSVLGNALTAGLASFIVMPAIVASLIFMPISMDAPFLKLGALALDLIEWIAAKISGLPFANIQVHAMSTASILWILLGIIWILVWRQSWRRLGFVAILIGLLCFAFWREPTVLVDSYGTLFGVVKPDGIVLVNTSKYKPNKFLLSSWEQRIGKPIIDEPAYINAFKYKIPRGSLGGEFDANGVFHSIRNDIGRRPWNK